MAQNSFQLQKKLKNYSKKYFFQNSQMAPKMFLDIVGVITTSKLSILKTFQGGAPGAPTPCQIGLMCVNISNVYQHLFYSNDS